MPDDANQPGPVNAREASADLLSGRDSGSRSGAEYWGSQAALAHRPVRWSPSGPYSSAKATDLRETGALLGQLRSLCGPREQNLTGLLEGESYELASILPEALPEELPFLEGTGNRPPRPRIAAALRDWLLKSPPNRREANLRAFLEGYQRVSPLYLAEISALPTAMRLMIAERCRLLPIAPHPDHHHAQLLPCLIGRLFEISRFVASMNWKNLQETLSRVDDLLRRDPAKVYPGMDFLTREAYRRSVAEIARATGATEAGTAGRALALATRRRETGHSTAGHVGYFLLGQGRRTLAKSLTQDSPPHRDPQEHSRNQQPTNGKRPTLRLDFSGGIPSGWDGIFTQQGRAGSRDELHAAVARLEAQAAAGESDQVKFGLLLSLEGGPEERSRLAAEARSVLGETNSRRMASGRPRLLLFLQEYRRRAGRAPIRLGTHLLIPLPEPANLNRLRQLAGVWSHPLNRPRVRKVHGESIRPIRPKMPSRPEPAPIGGRR